MALKFRDITKKVNKKDVNLLTGKAIKRRTSKKKHPKKTYVISNNIDTSLNVDANAEYKEVIEGMVGAINSLPEDLQRILNNVRIKGIKKSSTSTMFSLEGNYTIKLTDTTIGNKNVIHILMKQKKNILIDTQL